MIYFVLSNYKNPPYRRALLKIIKYSSECPSISDILIIVLLFLFVNKIDPSFIDGSATFFEYNNFKRI